MAQHWISTITLDDSTVVRLTPEIAHERSTAIADLLEKNEFAPVGAEALGKGPYAVHLSMADHRLIMQLETEGDGGMHKIILPLKPFRRIVKDYFLICESYFNALKRETPQQIEAIDMGRRGMHNEGAEMLQNHLEGKVVCDFDTARRLFTLLCVLHIK